MVEGGETLGVVGESGCGKSTLGRCLVALERPTSGEILVGRVPVHDLRGAAARRFCATAQYIFQDPYSSLDPRMRVGRQLAEPLAIHRHMPRAARPARVAALLNQVGLSPEAATRYPHEFSGGQRQRIVIARALALSPRLLVADEPVSSLDVSVQAQILNLLVDLRRRYALTMVFVAHDLQVIEFMSDRVAVMYLGVVVELARRDALFVAPQHPYTKTLLGAALCSDPSRRAPLGGASTTDAPSPLNRPEGCSFNPRCAHRMAVCMSDAPPLREFAPGHQVACWAVPSYSGQRE